jgi:very-short-patch-repair endonuclease
MLARSFCLALVRRKIIPYNPKLKEFARQHRNHSTQSEIRLWSRLKGKRMFGYDFHRQKPIGNFILDFFCHELMLGIELQGLTHDWEEVQGKDKVKTAEMDKLGITVLRFNDDDVMKDIDNVMLQIVAFIENVEEQKRLGE